jgi:CheY-like chemotaxis protein
MKPGLASAIETRRPFGLAPTKKGFPLRIVSHIAQRKTTPEGGRSVGGLRIMLVESPNETVNQLGRKFSEWGHSCDIACSAAAAERLAQWRRPQVIIFNIDLPALNPSNLARRLKAILGNFDTLILGYTSPILQAQRRSQKDSPFDIVLAKPFKLSVLHTLLLLETAHQEKTARLVSTN